MSKLDTEMARLDKKITNISSKRSTSGSWGFHNPFRKSIRSRKSMGRQPKTRNGQIMRGDLAYGRSSRGETISVRKSKLSALKEMRRRNLW